MGRKPLDERIKTGIRNLDEVLFGGIPRGSLVVFAGSPGSGKTILSQQIAFKNSSTQERTLIFQTLSEPTTKTAKFLRQFSFFDLEKIQNGSVHFVDLGDILRSKGLEEAVNLFMEHIKRVKPAFVVIDSFKVFEDLARSREELRKFSYEVAVKLMAWETTAFLLGEFGEADLQTNPLFSIIDGIIKLSIREESGEQQRFLQVVKMRGTNHSRDMHPFEIAENGIDIFAPKVTIRREPDSDRHITEAGPDRAKVGIPELDFLLGDGIPYGSSLLVSGVAGTGKTLLSLEFIYRGAHEMGEKGIFISFEETPERLRTNAKSMGWDLEGEIEKGNVEILFIPQTDVLIEKNLLSIREHIEKLDAKRVAIDSVSVFLHKIVNPQLAREKIFQLATLVQIYQAVGFFTADIPYGSELISRFGVEETVVDGVILLTSIQENSKRNRFIEIYKLRNTAHKEGKFKIHIEGGIKIETKHHRAESKSERKLEKITFSKKSGRKNERTGANRIYQHR